MSLPKTKSDAFWVTEGINAMNHASERKSILILSNDREYCDDCYYIIGVVTHDLAANYKLQIRELEAKKSLNTHLLRLGGSKTLKL